MYLLDDDKVYLRKNSKQGGICSTVSLSGHIGSLMGGGGMSFHEFHYSWVKILAGFLLWMLDLYRLFHGMKYIVRRGSNKKYEW